MTRRKLAAFSAALWATAHTVTAGPDRKPDPPERLWLVLLPKGYQFLAAQSSHGTLAVRASTPKQAVERVRHAICRMDHGDAGMKTPPKSVRVHPWGDRLEPGPAKHVPWVEVEL